MSQRKIIRVRNDTRRRRRYLPSNPLWPLEELCDLRNPPFVADPEFTPFDVVFDAEESTAIWTWRNGSPIFGISRTLPTL